MRKVKLILVAIVMIAGYSLNAQVAVNTDGSSADASAMLDVKSTDKVMLIPRMSQTQMNGITNPATGLSVYNTDVNAVCYFNGTKWDCMDSQSIFDKTFFCGDVLKDFRDGQSYNTVQIGTQCWMTKNLNIGTRIDGADNQTNNSTIEKYCYNNEEDSCDVYGGLYQWNEIMQYSTTAGVQGICPTGWHVPTDAEWCILENEVDAGTVSCTATGYRGIDAGGNLKETGTSHWNPPNTGATNSSGFIGLPGGYRTTSGPFNGLANGASFWSSNENGSNAWSRNLYFSSIQVDRSNLSKVYGFSVRCLKD